MEETELIDAESRLDDLENAQVDRRLDALEKKLDALIESLKRRKHHDARGDNVCVFCGDPAPCSCACGG